MMDGDGWGLGGVADSCVLFSFFAKSERREPDDAKGRVTDRECAIS
jgi:hypothetical protein